ncbi:MAG TPA: LytTR family DNA-binding domain-containing protein [Chitinophagaceae bacterium]|nr:LytTR family DNA-binding domain-containing protein [Chitinophagaceae bacterium]
MIQAILIDDEPFALKNLQSVLEKYCPQVMVSATAASVTDGLEKIRKLKPDLVFLDIELSGQNSFELLDQLSEPDFEKIFVTAHSHFGIQAVKHNASDYVLKPIDKAELIDAVDKAERRIYTRRILREQQAYIKNNRLALPTLEGLLFVDLNKVMYCESDGRYTRFYLTAQEKKILVSKNIGEYEVILPAAKFVRIHSQYIVNLDHVEKYLKGRGGSVVLSNGTELEVSARKKDHFLGSFEL